MPRVTQAYLDDRRRGILVAAHRCFARKGFHATTIQEIAERAGLSAGALYRYFDGKEELIEALAAWGREQKREALAGLEPGGGAEGLRRSLVEILHLLETEGADDAARLDVRLWGEALGHARLRKIVEGSLGALREPIAAYVRKEQRAGRMRSDLDPAAVAHTAVALLVGIEAQKALDPDLDPSACARVLSALVGGLAA